MRADEKPQVKRILLVDDDIDLLMLLERKLQRSGYIIESAASMPEVRCFGRNTYPLLTQNSTKPFA